MPGFGKIVVGGGTGFIGSSLCNALKQKGYSVTVISRMPGPQRLTWHELAKNGLPDCTTAVVNLAGQNILDIKQRWSPGFKQNVWNSRVNTNRALADAIKAANVKPNAFIAMSGVGIYEPSSTAEYDEKSDYKESDFFAKLCRAIEDAAKLPAEVQCRNVVIRSGVVLGFKGGMIKELYLPFYMGVGGPVGSGEQFLPWIHIEDMVRLIIFAIETNSIEGVLNGVAPQQITNKQFSQAFGSALWRPALFPLPPFVLNTIFSQERANMLTKGQRVIPKRTQELGFTYLHPNINEALKDIVSSKK